MAQLVDIADLMDANDVATMLGLSRGTAVSVYQQRYPEMPRPVYDRGANRTKLWLRSEMQAWADTRNSRSHRAPEPDSPTPAQGGNPAGT